MHIEALMDVLEAIDWAVYAGAWLYAGSVACKEAIKFKNSRKDLLLGEPDDSGLVGALSDLQHTAHRIPQGIEQKLPDEQNILKYWKEIVHDPAYRLLGDINARFGGNNPKSVKIYPHALPENIEIEFITAENAIKRPVRLANPQLLQQDIERLQHKGYPIAVG